PLRMRTPPGSPVTEHPLPISNRLPRPGPPNPDRDSGEHVPRALGRPATDGQGWTTRTRTRLFAGSDRLRPTRAIEGHQLGARPRSVDRVEVVTTVQSAANRPHRPFDAVAGR